MSTRKILIVITRLVVETGNIVGGDRITK